MSLRPFYYTRRLRPHTQNHYKTIEPVDTLSDSNSVLVPLLPVVPTPLELPIPVTITAPRPREITDKAFFND